MLILENLIELQKSKIKVAFQSQLSLIFLDISLQFSFNKYFVLQSWNNNTHSILHLLKFSLCQVSYTFIKTLQSVT